MFGRLLFRHDGQHVGVMIVQAIKRCENVVSDYAAEAGSRLANVRLVNDHLNQVNKKRRKSCGGNLSQQCSKRGASYTYTQQ